MTVLSVDAELLDGSALASVFRWSEGWRMIRAVLSFSDSFSGPWRTGRDGSAASRVERRRGRSPGSGHRFEEDARMEKIPVLALIRRGDRLLVSEE